MYADAMKDDYILESMIEVLHPLKGIGQATDVAGVAVFLATWVARMQIGLLVYCSLLTVVSLPYRTIWNPGLLKDQALP